MTTQHLDERDIMQPAPQTNAFVEVRGPSGKLLGYYNPDTHQWKYEDKQRSEVVDLRAYQRRPV